MVGALCLYVNRPAKRIDVLFRSCKTIDKNRIGNTANVCVVHRMMAQQFHGICIANHSDHVQSFTQQVRSIASVPSNTIIAFSSSLLLEIRIK